MASAMLFFYFKVNMETKVCKRCGIEKDVSEFSKDKSCEDGYYLYCKKCRSRMSKENEIKKRSNENGELRCSKCGEYYPANEYYFRLLKSGFSKKCKKCFYNWEYFPDVPKSGNAVCVGCLNEYPLNDYYFYKARNKEYNIRCKKCSNGKKYFDNNKNKKDRIVYKKNDKKFCYDCKRWKFLSEFRVNDRSIDGYTHQCKECLSEVSKLRTMKRRIEFKNHKFDDNILFKCVECGKTFPYTPDYFKVNVSNSSFLEKKCNNCDSIYRKEYSKVNKEKIRERTRQYKKENYDLVLKRKREFYKKNKDKINNDKKEYYSSRIKFNSNAFKRLLKYETYRLDPNNNELGQVKCMYCDKWVNPIVSEVYERLKAIDGHGTEGQMSNIYCDLSCKLACPTYKKISSESNEGLSREVSSLIRKMCFERDDWECQMCGAKDELLHCHHIEGYTKHPQMANDIQNVITYCKHCHIKIHSQEGCNYRELKCKNGKIDFSNLEE